MNVHIRVRPYPNRCHGWLAWGMLFAGDRLPLAADEPDKELAPSIIDSNSKMSRLWKWETRKTSDGAKFIRDVMVIMKEAGHDETPAWSHFDGVRKFVQRFQEDFVDLIIVERMVDGCWTRIAQYERNPKTGQYVDTLTLSVKEGFFNVGKN